jgi:carbon starvation protein
MLSDTLGNLGGPLRRFRDPSWRFGAWICSLIVCGLWGAILLMGVTDPLGGINTLFPLFGIANQLLAAIALTLVTTVVIKKGYLKWAWIPGIPLLFDLTVTVTASWLKIFSADPKIGYWAQHRAFKDAQAAGETAFGTAKSPEAIDAVVRNTAVQGTLSIVFVTLVLVVFGAGMVVCVRAIRAGGLPTTEEPEVASHRFAPSGLVETSAEKQVGALWAQFNESTDPDLDSTPERELVGK